MTCHEEARHRGKEVNADELLHDWKRLGQCGDQRADDVVSMHRKSHGRVGTVVGMKARRHGLRRVQQRGGEAGL